MDKKTKDELKKFVAVSCIIIVAGLFAALVLKQVF